MNISVIITIYGVERYVEAAMESLLSQTMIRGVEFVVVNDATRDGSMEIVRRTALRHPEAEVRVVEMLRNGGVAAARMRGMAEARGEFIIFMDGDDTVERDMLEAMWNAAQRTEADIVVCDMAMVWPGGRKVLCEQRDLSVGGLVSTRTHGAMWNKLVRRSLYSDWAIAFTPTHNMWEDLTVCVELFMRARRIVHLPRPLIDYIQRRGSSMRNMSQSKLDSIVAAVTRIETLMRSEGITRRGERDLAARKWFAMHFLVQNSRGRAQRIYAAMWPELGDTPQPPQVASPFVAALTLTRRGHLRLANLIYDFIRLFKNLGI